MALATNAVKSVELYSGVESQVVEVQEAASIAANVWYDGDLVTTASGLVSAVASTGAIAGIAGATCTGTDYTKLDLFLIDPAAIYVMRMASTDYSARAYIGEAHGLTFTAGAQRILLSAYATPDVVVVGIHPSDKHADGSTGLAEGRILVRFNYDIFTGVSGA